MIRILRYTLPFLLLFMIYMIVTTSLESNLYKEWDYLGAIPWMRATLWDFYANILLIYLWVIYKEKSISIKILWAILFFCLGSVASISYVLIQLYKVKPDADIKEVL
ncbi:MAG TPA: DUF1475 family protein, partial [Cytophagaceae bacterium]|nr:DUF1475 family protein [Cytophagaceae bacterium]